MVQKEAKMTIIGRTCSDTSRFCLANVGFLTFKTIPELTYTFKIKSEGCLPLGTNCGVSCTGIN